MDNTAVLVAAISATASVLLAVVSLVVQPIILAKLAIAAKERDAQGTQLKEIHTLTNDNMSKLNVRLDTANAKIGELDRLISEMRSPSSRELPT